MCTLTTAKAHEIQLGVNTELGFQTNVLKTIIDPKPDGIFVLTPIITLAQPEEDLSYNIEYRPRFTAYMDTSDIDGLDHLLRGDGSYQFNSKDSVFFRTNFIRTRQIRNQSTIDASGQPITVASANGTTQQFFLEGSWQHSFGPRTFGTASLTYDRWDYTTENNIDNQGFRGQLGATHALSERLILSADAGARYRSFSSSSFSPASYNTTLNFNLGFDYRISEKWRLRGGAGPAGVFVEESDPAPRTVGRFAAIETGQGVCPAGFPCGRLWDVDPENVCGTSLGQPILATCLPSARVNTSTIPGFLTDTTSVSVDPSQSALFGQKRQSFTYFLNMSLVRRFENGVATVSFVRNEDAGTGFGTSTILNSVTGQFNYPLSEYWDLSLTGLYTFRESVSNLQGAAVSARAATDAGGAPLRDVLGNPLAEADTLVATQRISNFEQQVGLAELRVVRRLGVQSRLQFLFIYYSQRDRNGGSAWRSFNNFTGVVSYVFTFDSYQF